MELLGFLQISRVVVVFTGVLFSVIILFYLKRSTIKNSKQIIWLTLGGLLILILIELALNLFQSDPKNVQTKLSTEINTGRD